MFTFSLLVSIVQDKDLELSYCVLSVCMIGSSRIVVISQDTTCMTEEERQKIEALLRQCRRQTSEIEHDQRDWEERQAEKEWQQQKSGQPASPELGETSREKAPTSTLKVKSSKGRTVEDVQVGTSEQAKERNCTV